MHILIVDIINLEENFNSETPAQCIILVIISSADDFLAIRPEQNSLQNNSQLNNIPPRGTKRQQLTCSNWAVYEPFLSTRGG